MRNGDSNNNNNKKIQTKTKTDLIGWMKTIELRENEVDSLMLVNIGIGKQLTHAPNKNGKAIVLPKVQFAFASWPWILFFI